jgi:histidinol-phosphate aminotransferase
LRNCRDIPNPDAQELCEAIASVEHLSKDCVFCGNGSDEVLSFAFCAFFDSDLPLLFPDITYSFYPVFADFYGIPVREIPVDRNFKINVEDYSQPCCGVILPNPNAPSGICMDIADLSKLLAEHADKVVVIDEAYIAFGGVSAVSLITEHPNLLVIKTFSKSHSLAGLRVGYALGQPHLIDGLYRVKNSFNAYPIDRIAQTIAKTAILDRNIMRQSIKNFATRETFSAELKKLGFNFLPSKANFVLRRIRICPLPNCLPN